MKDKLITTGYPRSGNTFLTFSLKSLYFPTEKKNQSFHTLLTLSQVDKCFVPFRNPLDSIASWKVHREGDDLIFDIKFYSRFYKGILQNLDKVILMDFDYFTKNLDYIKNKVKDNFGFDPVANPTIDDIKNLMLQESREKNLPQNNKDILDAEKSLLKEMPEFQECMDLYLDLKNAI